MKPRPVTGWATFEVDDLVLVMPCTFVDRPTKLAVRQKGHLERSEFCPCRPKLDSSGARALLVHNDLNSNPEPTPCKPPSPRNRFISRSDPS